jgi:hypothetical protein
VGETWRWLVHLGADQGVGQLDLDLVHAGWTGLSRVYRETARTLGVTEPLAEGLANSPDRLELGVLVTHSSVSSGSTFP